MDYVPERCLYLVQLQEASSGPSTDVSHSDGKEREARHIKRMRRATDCVQVHKKKKAKGGQSVYKN